MGINQIVNKQNHRIVDDKIFMKKILLLLTLIIALSVFLIYHSIYTVHNMSDFNNKYMSDSQVLTLDVVERELNGNIINLEVIEDDFSDLAEMDLAELNRAKNSIPSSVVVNTKKPVKAGQADTKNARAIQISSVKIDKSARKPNSIAFMKKKFYATNNSVFSIKLAQKFYDNRKYKQALKWALISNEIDSKSETSWILFAKTKVKLGKKQDAINALSAYLQMHKSDKVFKLLQQFKTAT